MLQAKYIWTATEGVDLCVPIIIVKLSGDKSDPITQFPAVKTLLIEINAAPHLRRPRDVI